MVLLAPGSALAVFSRPSLEPITHTTSGPLGEELGGIAIDGEGNVYVGEGEPNNVIDKFSSSNVFLKQLTGLGTYSLAVENAIPESIYAFGEAGTGGVHAVVTVDNATGVHYVAEETTTGYHYVVRALDASGEPVAFSAKAEYIDGSELTGVPCEESGRSFCSFEYQAQLQGIAVDPSGDIYVSIASEPREVTEFAPSGLFIREFGHGSFGADGPEGVAVDPTDGDVLTVDPEHGVIDEFTSSGAFRQRITGPGRGELFDEHALSSAGIAVSAAGRVYVADNERHQVDVFGKGAFYPDVVTGGVTNGTPTSVTLNGVVNDENVGLEGCKFEFVPEAVFKLSGFAGLVANEEARCETPGVSEIRRENKNQLVHADVKGLKEGVVYRYRLVAATNESEEGGVQEGPVESFAVPGRPVVEAVSVGDVSSSWAEFHATIDPAGSDTTYQVEYLTEAAFAADGDSWVGAGGSYSPTSVPVPASDVGAGDTGVSVVVRADGLSPATAYVYRVVASNGVGVTDVEGPEETFATSPAGLQGLPDGRVYEMVTPPNKEDGEDLFGGPPDSIAKEDGEDATNYDLGYSSEDGEHFLLLTAAAFGSFPASGEGTYVFSRGPDGWSAQSSASPALGVQSAVADVYDAADFSVLGVSDQHGAAVSEQGAELVGPPGGPYATIESGMENSNPPTLAAIVGASSDLSHVVLESEDHALAPGDLTQDPGSEALYDWTAAEGLRLVNVNSAGKLLSRCGAILGLGSANDHGYNGNAHGAVSADGSKIVFTAPDPTPQDEGGPRGPGCWTGGTSNPPEVYVREGEKTVELSTPELGVKEAGHAPALQPAMYVGACKDGSRVFFLTETELTEEAAKLKLHDLELYEYNTEPGNGEPTLVRVSRGQRGAATETAAGGVENVPAISTDGSVVYFNAAGSLTANAPAGHGPYLYRYETTTGTTTYVAPSGGYTAARPGASPWYAGAIGNRDFVGLSVEPGADYYTTADGIFLVFPSTQDITGYDSDGQQELYRYHYEPQSASGGSIVCVSCNPSGSAPSSGATFTRSVMRLDNPAGTVPRPISENGEYVFFDTEESLLPADTNGKVDVYEWHENPSSHERTIGSISTGESSTNDYFLDSSPDGKNVFFGTHSQLVPADKDEQGDLYDARIDGGFPAPIGAGPCEQHLLARQHVVPPT